MIKIDNLVTLHHSLHHGFFGGFGAWGGIGLDLHAPNKIKTARPARLRCPTQNPTGQGKLNKKRTKWCVLILVPVVGLNHPQKSAKICSFIADFDLKTLKCLTLCLALF